MIVMTLTKKRRDLDLEMSKKWYHKKIGNGKYSQ